DLERAHPTEALKGADFADTPVPFPEGYAAGYWIKKWGQAAYDTVYPRLADAVDAVAGVQMQYEGKPIFAAYHAISSGTTELPEVVWASAFPYLQSVKSESDANAPDYESTLRLTSEQLREKIAGVDGIELSGDPAAWIGDEVTRSAAGTVLRITVGGVALTGRECRTLLGLRSACFSVAYEDGVFTFTVHGHGHGVGMSQYGAAFLAEQGASYEDILHHYYTDVEIV
ncbi:MAG: SpoIID/LytB domain-containing protein, partial [Clostridia bacterium]|nr:SpoIID/LytB domain-containing protein [Clostridia bacterium]